MMVLYSVSKLDTEGVQICKFEDVETLLLVKQITIYYAIFKYPSQFLFLGCSYFVLLFIKK